MQTNIQVRSHIEKHVSWLKKALSELENVVREKIDEDPNLSSKNKLLQSIPGIGEKTSAAMLAYVAFERFQSAKEWLHILE